MSVSNFPISSSYASVDVARCVFMRTVSVWTNNYYFVLLFRSSLDNSMSIQLSLLQEGPIKAKVISIGYHIRYS